MPLPWKKTRSNRISQFVADLHSPKRGGSLVVQTGFPAFLIDLFVKNRDHLKKPSKKHKNKKKNQNRAVDRVEDPITANPDVGSSDFAILVRPSLPKVETLTRKEADHGEIRLMEETHVENRVVGGEVCGGGNWTAVLLAVVKMFAVGVLTLSTKKLAVGITLSAFVLLFLEYAGKHLACCLKPCSNAKSVFRNLGRRASAFLLVLNGLDDVEALRGFDESEGVKGATLREKTGGVVFDLVDNRSESNSEVQIVEAKKGGSTYVDENGGEGTLVESLEGDYEKKRVVDKGSVALAELLGMDHLKREMDRRRLRADKTAVGEVSLVKLLGTDYEKSKRSKNTKIKSKLIKKFVPKKLRRKGKHNEPELEPVGCSEGDDKVDGFEEQEEHKDGKLEEEECENISALSLDAEEKSESERFDGVCDHSEGSLAGGETPSIFERKGKEGEGSFGYLILFLIVLAGLFGGRIVALMLTITFCFMSKLIGTLRRLVKVCP